METEKPLPWCLHDTEKDPKDSTACPEQLRLFCAVPSVEEQDPPLLLLGPLDLPSLPTQFLALLHCGPISSGRLLLTSAHTAAITSSQPQPEAHSELASCFLWHLVVTRWVLFMFCLDFIF